MYSTDIQNEIIADSFQPKYWWERKDLHFKNDRLFFGGQELESFYEGDPTYIYSLSRVEDNLKRLHESLTNQELRYSIHYAMKSNRHASILKHIAKNGLAKVDVCSPNELERAIECGFKQSQINYTGTSLSRKDWGKLKDYSFIQFNADSLSSIKEVGERNLFSSIGIRINPLVGLGYNESLEYSGKTITKFGIYPDRIEEAFELAKHYNLSIDTIHFHAGSGYLTPQLENLESILNSIRPLVNKYKISKINIGGGLGVVQQKGDLPLDLDKWGSLLKNFSDSVDGVEIQLEPGDYIVKDAGVLLAEVTYIEDKSGVNFLGLNVGMNINYEYAYYKMNLELIPLQNRATEKKKPYVIAGNINEPIDLFGEGVRLSGIEVGDIVALINTGGYGASTASNHCMRGEFKEVII